jgi:hypothetical protein
MKINNKNVIKSLLTIHLAITAASVFIIVVVGFLFPYIFSKAQFLGYLFVTYCVVKIFRLRYIEYENSGEVLSLKKYSVFHLQNPKNQIEMPLYKINNLYVKKSFWYHYLIINFRRDDQKYMKIHFPIDHLKNSDLQKIQNNFKNYKNA